MSREAFLENLPLVRAEQGREGRFRIRGVAIGGGDPVVIAGPCAVESGVQIREIAVRVKQCGAQGLRGGVFKPRSSPYSFQGLGGEGLQYLKEARDETGLFTVVEVTASEQIPCVADYADVLQIGARNMQNFDLLRAAGRSGRPVLLKRGLSATIQEFLQAAEYILVEGNPHVILCERGIRTFETLTRNTLDINAIPLLKQLTHLPVFADPSHGTGRSDLVIPVAKAALAAGADGIIVEVHPDPGSALSDGNQSLNFKAFAALMNQLPRISPGSQKDARSAPQTRVMDSTPDKARFLELAQSGKYSYIPVYRRLVTDSETPVTAFAKLTNGQEARAGRFLLESVERGEQLGRYSFIGWDPLAIFKAAGVNITILQEGTEQQRTGEPLAGLRQLLEDLRIAPAPALDRLCGGAVGYIGYDYIRQIERIPDKNSARIGIPDLYWMIPRYLASFDHVNHQITLIVMARLDGDGGAQANEAAYENALSELQRLSAQLNQSSELPPLEGLMCEHADFQQPGECRFSVSKAEYMAGVGRIKEYIAAGDAFQVVFSQRMEQCYRGDPYLFYRLLRTINPSPYLFYLDFGRFQLVGSSPEVMVKLEGRQAVLKPIAGTRPRGATPVEDEILRRELLADEKERAEHVMLVDLGRNDLGRVCRCGTVNVTELMRIENYSHVMHIVSTIQGELMSELSGIDLLRAAFPAGTLSGAPKIRAMEIIEELEPMRREFYGGAVGYLGVNGSLDTCITIRTALFKDGTAYLQVGAGVVADSDPEKEYLETMNKAGAMLDALNRTEAVCNVDRD